VISALNFRSMVIFGAMSAALLLTGCAGQQAGVVGPAIPQPAGATQPRESGLSGGASTGPTAPTDQEVSGPGNSQQFNVGSDRVDSATRVSDQRQNLVTQAAKEHFSGRPNLSIISVRAADESPRRSGAHVVVNDGGVPVDLALTVELKKGTWRVTNALAFNVGVSR
jgi:hypothetical protein